MDSGMFKGLQIAASEALNLPANFHDKRNEVYVKRRAIAEEMAGILACTFSEGQGGLFLWMEIPDSRQSAEEFSEEILEKTDVFITPGFIFGKNGERFLRISLCSKLPLLQEALERLKTRL